MVCTLTLFIVFFYIINKVLSTCIVMLSIYAKLSSHLLALERERATSHMQGSVLTLVRLKIVPTIKNMYVSNASVLTD